MSDIWKQIPVRNVPKIAGIHWRVRVVNFGLLSPVLKALWLIQIGLMIQRIFGIQVFKTP